MDGFFERYGRMIIVAVAICFVLLYLTPMRNVVGSSINGFAGNFANKVGESLGTVKMPDGSGGATDSEGVKAGSILKIEGNEYIVLEQRENSQALIMAASSIGNKAFHYRFNYSTHLRPDGQQANTYEGSEIDNYLEKEWYDSFPKKVKSAIQVTTIKQASYATYNDTNSKQETGYNGQVYNTISRHVFLPSVSEIGKVVNLKDLNKNKTFLNGIDIWTRDSYQGNAYSAEYLYANYGTMNNLDVSAKVSMRPAFVINLSQVDYKAVGTTNYK